MKRFRAFILIAMADHRRDLNGEVDCACILKSLLKLFVSGRMVWRGKLLGRQALLHWSIVNDGGGLTGTCRGHRKQWMDSQVPSESWKFLLFSYEIGYGF